jgi:MFS transporter, UMF1 family
MVAAAVTLFIFTNIFYQTSMMFYNSFLTQLSTRKTIGIVSGFGFALGYIGGLLILIIVIPFIRGGLQQDNIFNIRITFLVTSFFFLVFSIPSFIILRDIPAVTITKKGISYIIYGFRKFSATVRNIKAYPDLSRFLIGQENYHIKI